MTDPDFILPADWPLSDEERAIGYTTDSHSAPKGHHKIARGNAPSEVQMPTDRRRIMLTVNDEVFRALALDPVQHGATQVHAALARYAEHVGRASRRIEKVLTREEWNAIADVMNGCADLWEYSGTALSHLLCIKANVEDGHRLDGLGYKWFGDGETGDRGIKTLLTKLGKLTEIEGDAIAASVRYFWADASGDRAIDHTADEWWTLAYRTKGRQYAKAD